MPETQPAELCSNCEEAQHVYSCPKPPNISVKKWQKMSDYSRLKTEFKHRKLLLREKQQVTINEEQGLYVIPASHGGYSCLGFDVAFRKSQAVYDWLLSFVRNSILVSEPLKGPDIKLKGTLEGYREHERIMDLGALFHARTLERCPAELHPKLIGLEGKRVEVTRADGTTRKFRVGKSTGWFPTHLCIEKAKDTGGFAISHDEVFLSVRPLSR